MHIKSIGVGPKLTPVFEVVELPVHRHLLADSIVNRDAVQFEIKLDDIREARLVYYAKDGRLGFVFVVEVESELVRVGGCTVLVVQFLGGSLSILELCLIVSFWFEEVSAGW